MQRFGLQSVSPTDQRGIIGRWFPEQATEPAQHQALVDPIFGLLIAPAIQVLEQQHTQENFDRCGMAPMHQGVAIPLAKVVAHLLIQRVIIEQPIQLLEHRIDPFGHLGHTCKDIFFGVAIDQHARTPPCACFFFYPYSVIFLSHFSHGHLSLSGHWPLKPLHMPHFAPQTSTRSKPGFRISSYSKQAITSEDEEKLARTGAGLYSLMYLMLLLFFSFFYLFEQAN